MSETQYDIAVIGAGMAGAAIAAHLSERASVRLFDMEDQPGYHSTGRSAALFSETYGNAAIRALTRASRAFFFDPPDGFSGAALVKPRALLTIARTEQAAALEAMFDTAEPWDQIERKSAAEALEIHPLLKTDELYGAGLRLGLADIDVNELLQGYLRLLRSRNGVVSTGAAATRLEHDGGSWRVTTANEVVRAAVVVNAAGAWAGEIGRLAGAINTNLQPMRRTAILLDPPPHQPSEHWPMLIDVEEQFYLKPDAGKLLLSPADETPSPPCDAQPDEMDIAIAVDRLERATTLEVRRITHKWAGLRSFVADRSPVVGYDPVKPGFFWLAALGGYGIQTAPALSRVAASLVLDRRLDEDIAAFGVDVQTISPRRLSK